MTVAKKTTPEAEPQVAIRRIAAETIIVPIRGTAPLLVHKWSEKAKRQMLDKMTGRRTPKAPKDPEAEFQASIYRMNNEDHYGFPVLGFKACTVEASRLYDKSVTKVGLMQTLFFTGEYSKTAGQQLTRIVAPDPDMREDVVTVGVKGTDLRYRAEFTADWTASLTVTYISSSITQDSVLSLIDAGGLTVGVGEWRPAKSGNFGTFQIDDTRKVEVLRS